MSAKLLAFHLPQFHTFPENDDWWGEGFTEWTNTKKAKKLYKDHNQPREPLNDYYYDLSKLDAMLWQMNLAKEYGIYGFCYYHYWFDGKLLLQKPLETIRDYNGEKLNYCLCWANEPWTRVWEGHANEVLIAQEYGGEPEWEEHFQYLLSFFKDQYYILINNRPLLVLYRCNNIPNCDEMIAYWDQRCQESGYSGIYVMEEMNSFQPEAVCRNTSAVVEFEPLYTMTYDRNFINKVEDKLKSAAFNKAHSCNNSIYSYDRLWKIILQRRRKSDGKMRCYGAFVDWDNTARKGPRGRIVMDTTPEKFGKYLSKQKKLADENGSEYIFLNAWNEWGEGTYLEPDKVNGYKYLEEIRSIFGAGGAPSKLYIVHPADIFEKTVLGGAAA